MWTGTKRFVFSRAVEAIVGLKLELETPAAAPDLAPYCRCGPGEPRASVPYTGLQEHPCLTWPLPKRDTHATSARLTLKQKLF